MKNKTENEDRTVRRLYTSRAGRTLLKVLIRPEVSKVAGAFLASPLSRPMVSSYIRKNDIDMTPFGEERYSSFRDFFVRYKETDIKPVPGMLISPCDSLLECFPIGRHSKFRIKGSEYRVSDLCGGSLHAEEFTGGICLVFRLQASDYHHYCFCDSGTHSGHKFIPGSLHSVQPVCLENYPVFTLNRRVCTMLETEHFGRVMQTEIGALVVGKIVNIHHRGRFSQGEEMGHFEPTGSTITLLLKKDSFELLPELAEAWEREIPVKMGQPVGTAPGMKQTAEKEKAGEV